MKNYHVAFLKDDEMFNIDVTTTCSFKTKIQICFINCKTSEREIHSKDCID